MADYQTEPSSLQMRVAREVVALVRRQGMRCGDHLTEALVARHVNTSRSPIQGALRYLSELGLVHKDANRGYFLASDGTQWTEAAEMFAAEPDDPLYLAIAKARQTKSLDDVVTEADLMRRFGVARSTLRKVLTRISKEGWIARKAGNGWAFLPAIDSEEAYVNSYLFRKSIEPAAVRSPSFEPDVSELEALLAEQRRIAEGGYQTMAAIELFEANTRFHESVAGWSGNTFIVQGIQRVNQLRRLVEYRQTADRPTRQAQAVEHVEILTAIRDKDYELAASLLERHLDLARTTKLADRTIFRAATVGVGVG